MPAKVIKSISEPSRLLLYISLGATHTHINCFYFWPFTIMFRCLPKRFPCSTGRPMRAVPRIVCRTICSSSRTFALATKAFSIFFYYYYFCVAVVVRDPKDAEAKALVSSSVRCRHTSMLRLHVCVRACERGASVRPRFHCARERWLKIK